MKPLVSILIPAYNAEPWIADTIRSALAQTWPHKEIIVVDDGSKDRTLAVANQFSSQKVKVIAQQNQGAAAARNRAYAESQGDFIQWLDADDLISGDKVAKQVEFYHKNPDPLALLSSGWGWFLYRPSKARFCASALWADLAPVEWIVRKLGQNLHMQTSTWLVTRKLSEVAGPWDTHLSLDDDGEYFCRVLLASKGTRFVAEGKTYYRSSGFSSLSKVDGSGRKLASQLRSMQLHIEYLRSLEESVRVREACLFYLRTWLPCFYPERPELVERLQELARSLHGKLEPPNLSWKYAWIRPLFGWSAAKQTQFHYNKAKLSFRLGWDWLLSRLAGGKGCPTETPAVSVALLSGSRSETVPAVNVSGESPAVSGNTVVPS